LRLTAKTPRREPVADATPAAGEGSPLRNPRTWLRTIALGLLGLVAAVAYAYSGILVALSASLSPNPGNDAALLLVKVVDILGWLAIGGWLLLDWLRLRARVFGAPAAAWLWAYAFAGFTSAFGFLNWGY
jgi:hypothetical protein